MTKQANLADQVFDAVKGWLQRNVTPLAERIKALEERAPIAGEKGDPGDAGPAGPAGRDGVDGKDGLTGERGADGINGKDGAPGMDGRDGADGKDADPQVAADLALELVKQMLPGLISKGVEERMQEIIAKAAEAVPRPVDGKDGAPGPAGRDGIDGKDIDPDAVKATIEGLVAEIPRPADGLPGKDGRDGIDGKDGAPGERGADGIGIKGDPGMDGRDGRDGEPGRDAIQIDIVPAIEVGKRYQRGTFAKFDGGLIRAFRATDPMNEGDLLEKAGWEVVVQGVSGIRIEREDEGRTLRFVQALTGSTPQEHTFSYPVAIYRGVFQADTEYVPGDMTTWEGSVWHAQKATQDKPGKTDAWKLAVKHGRDGRDGNRGEKGERGAEGRAGRDLTQMGPDGGKF